MTPAVGIFVVSFFVCALFSGGGRQDGQERW